MEYNVYSIIACLALCCIVPLGASFLVISCVMVGSRAEDEYLGPKPRGTGDDTLSAIRGNGL